LKKSTNFKSFCAIEFPTKRYSYGIDDSALVPPLSSIGLSYTMAKQYK